MIIYRWQQGDGGVYRCGGPGHSIGLSPIRHPDPSDDFEDGMTAYDLAKDLGCSKQSDLLFGFTSIPMMNLWFSPSEQAVLRAAGAELLTFEVDPAHVIATERQAVFDRSKATKITPAMPTT